MQVKNDFITIGEAVSFLQEFLQVKVDNIIYTINLSSKDDKCKEANTVSNPVATTIWKKLSA